MDEAKLVVVSFTTGSMSGIGMFLMIVLLVNFSSLPRGVLSYKDTNEML